MKRAALLCLVLASCTSDRPIRKVLSTTRVGYYQGHDDMDFVHGSKNANGENYGFTISIEPLAFLEPPTIVEMAPTLQPEPVEKPK